MENSGCSGCWLPPGSQGLDYTAALCLLQQHNPAKIKWIQLEIHLSLRKLSNLTVFILKVLRLPHNFQSPVFPSSIILAGSILPIPGTQPIWMLCEAVRSLTLSAFFSAMCLVSSEEKELRMLCSSLWQDKQVPYTSLLTACGDTWYGRSTLCALVEDWEHLLFLHCYKDSSDHVSLCFRVPSLAEISAKLHIAQPHNDNSFPELNIYSSPDCQYEVSKTVLFYS